jgi:Family of unknown function (DUF6421)
VNKFPSVGFFNGAADSTLAVATLRGRGQTMRWLTDRVINESELHSVDTIVVDAATPALPLFVWEWVKQGGGLVCVGQPSKAITADLSELTGYQWHAAPSLQLVSLAAPRTDEFITSDLLAGVSDVKAWASHWVATTDSPQGRVVLETVPEGLSALVVVKAGAGRVALIADPSLVADTGLASAPLQALWRNTVTWAAGSLVRTVTEHLATTDQATETANDPAWIALKTAVEEFRPLQAKDGSLLEGTDKRKPRAIVKRIIAAIKTLAPRFPHDADYLLALQDDLADWSKSGLGTPDFLDSLLAFRPELDRVDGLEHLVLFPMYTQNGNANRNLEAVLLSVVWPDFVAELEHTYTNPAFVPVSFTDFTGGYDTASAVLFPETVSVREVPTFTWGAIFCDREAARFRRVIGAAVETMRLPLPPEAERLLASHELAQETFVAWDLIHDRAHSRGDLPFDPFMIKQRMPFWLYSLEELRCDLTAFRAAVDLEKQGVPHASLVQYAIFFDRTFRFPITGGRTRNYDGLGGQLLFAYLHQAGVLNWTDNRLTVDWERLPGEVIGLLDKIEHLYWRSIDRSKTSHWLAAYDLVSTYVEPHPASTWAQGRQALPLTGELKELTNLVMPDEFPLSMFFEALDRRLAGVVSSTAGITAPTPDAE